VTLRDIGCAGDPASVLAICLIWLIKGRYVTRSSVKSVPKTVFANAWSRILLVQTAASTTHASRRYIRFGK